MFIYEARIYTFVVYLDFFLRNPSPLSFLSPPVPGAPLEPSLGCSSGMGGGGGEVGTVSCLGLPDRPVPEMPEALLRKLLMVEP